MSFRFPPGGSGGFCWAGPAGVHETPARQAPPQGLNPPDAPAVPALELPKDRSRSLWQPISRFAKYGFDPPRHRPDVPYTGFPRLSLCRGFAQAKQVRLRGRDLTLRVVRNSPTGLMRTDKLRVAPVPGFHKYLVIGSEPGLYWVQVLDQKQRIVDVLEVSVKQARRLSVAFHFVIGPTRRTGRRNTEPLTLLAQVNDIIRPQTGVEFVLASTSEVYLKPWGIPEPAIWTAERVRAYLIQSKPVAVGDQVRYRDFPDHNAAINVFFVWDYETPGHEGEVGGHALDAATGSLALKDSIKGGLHGLALAHEIMHILLMKADAEAHVFGGKQVHSRVSTDLMYPNLDPHATHIGRLEADAVNPTGIR